MNKKIGTILRKCKSLSKRAAAETAVVLVGSSRRRYTISARHLSHPVFGALLDWSAAADEEVSVRCEVVLFDHLLWMLENDEPDEVAADGPRWKSWLGSTRADGPRIMNLIKKHSRVQCSTSTFEC